MSFIIPIMVTLLFYHVLFIWSIQAQDFSVVDIGWALSFSILHLSHSSIDNLYYHIFSAMLFAWSLRLGHYLFIRWWHKKSEDWRYRELRESWGEHARAQSYFKIFLMQSIMMMIIALPVWVINHSELTKGPINAWGLIIFLVGIILEGIADWQLYFFKKNPENHGKRLKKGVWQLSHPNYKGEILIWIGLALHAYLATGKVYVLLSPLILHLIMRFLTGEALLKKRLQELN